jgi:hypothetical protein
VLYDWHVALKYAAVTMQADVLGSFPALAGGRTMLRPGILLL